ncbi:MAG: flavodoxin [Chromatiales bacterium]|jgi:flavodoxin I
MKQTGIFFGTDSGTTRLIAKKIVRSLKQRVGDEAVAKPLNVNRISPDELAGYDALILGTPTYGEGVLPGKASKNTAESWLEFLPQLEGMDFSGTRIALFGLGDQEEYPEHFLDAMRDLYDFFESAGAELIGFTSTEGFEFSQSRAVIDSQFVGLALDQHLQHLLTDQRIEDWLDQVTPLLSEVQPDKASMAG